MPPLVHSQAEQRLISLLGREVRIGKIGFSPWSLSADAPPPALTSAQRDAIVKRIYSDTKLPNKPRSAIGIARDIPVAEMEALLCGATLVTSDSAREPALGTN